MADVPSNKNKNMKQALALDAARDSIALVKNDDDTLPLHLEAGQTLLLAGPGCNSLVRQAGGWSLHWCVSRRSSSRSILCCVVVLCVHPYVYLS
jgi:beta-glucosidase-like glycosyl hydrolase